MRLSGGLGLVMPGIIAHVEHGGKKETIEIGLDTGIPHKYVAINTDYARRLGISKVDPRLEKITIETASGPCTFHDLPVWIDPTVGASDGHTAKIYLGAPLIEKMGGRIILSESGGFSLDCGKPGPKPNFVPGFVGVSIGLIGTWILLKWLFK